MKRTRRNHGATFKAQVALAAIKGDKTLSELAEPFSVHPTQITEWKQQLLARAAEVFGGAYSDPIRPLIPTQVGHPFRRNAATDSEVNPATFPSPLGIGGRHPVESWAG
jgi:transposase-like protein